jgi:hypothetical protein
MLRSLTDHTTRLMAIGVIGLFAAGGLPAIAAACEGAGEEVYQLEVVSEVEETKSNQEVTTLKNPFDFEVKFTVLEPVGMGGTILATSTCKLGGLVAALKTCVVEQVKPKDFESKVVKG